MNKFKIIEGRKNEKDKILLYNGKPVTFVDVAIMCRFFIENEEAVYPPPRYKGGQMFIDYIKEVLDTRKIPNNKKYQLDKTEVVLV